MKYRPEIDGLRAFAVLPVVFFHSGFSLFKGGYVGVDVFFVISGYLITTIVCDDIERGTFSILKFFENRARRILPALFLVMLSCAPFAIILMLPSEVWDFFQSLVAATLFSSNILFLLETGDYFNPSAYSKPLLHTWSLGVEEQFYLFAPLLILFSYRWFAKWRLGFFGLICFASFAAMVHLASRFPEEAFFLTFTRAWELLVGAVAAFWLREVGSTPSDAKTGLGIFLILFAATFFDKNSLSWLASLTAVAGSMLVVMYSHGVNLSGRILRQRLVTGIGVMSYSLYLWHWPIVVFYNYRLLDPPDLFDKLAALTLMFAVSFFSWRYIENHFRRGSRGYDLKSRSFSSLAIGSAGLIVLIGLYGHFNFRYPDSAFSYLPRFVNQTQFAPVQSDRMLLAEGRVDVSTLDSFDRRKKSRVLVLGDSHSIDLYNALYQNQGAFDDAQFKHAYVDWSCLTENYFGDVPESQIEVCMQSFLEENNTELDAATHVVFSNRWLVRPAVEQFLEIYIRALQERSIQALVTSNTVEFTKPAPDIAHRIFKSGDVQSVSEFPIGKFDNALFAHIDPEVQRINKVVSDVARKLNVPFLEKFHLLCDHDAKSCDGVTPQGEFIYTDYGHWSLTGAAYIGARIVDSGWIKLEK